MQLTESNKGSTIMRATQGIEFKPLIKTLVERNAVGMIVAPAKAKKSMLALNLVFSLLTKKPFLGLPVSDEPEKIVYVNLELTKLALGVRLRSMNTFYNATPKQLDNVMFLSSDEFCKGESLVDTKTQKVNVDPTGYGKCEHPDNFPIDQRMASENACPKFVLYPALN